MNERRNDVGLKLIYVILTAVITLSLTLFFNKTYNLAENASAMGYENKTSIAVLQQSYKEIERRLTSIDTKIDKLIIK